MTVGNIQVIAVFTSIIAFVVFMLVLSFTGKSRIRRFIPVAVFSILTIVSIIKSHTSYTLAEGLGYGFLAYATGIMAVSCALI